MRHPKLNISDFSEYDPFYITSGGRKPTVPQTIKPSSGSSMVYF